MKSFLQFLSEREVVRSSPEKQSDFQSKLVTQEKPGYSRLGRGAFGTVINKNKDDSTYKIYRSDQHDVAANFHRHAMTDHNPHLPKIEKMVTVKHYDGQHTVISKMEKLHPLHSLSNDELKSAWGHSFGPTTKKVTPQLISNRIKSHLKFHSGEGKHPGSASANMENALHDVATIASNGNGKIDMKPENVMARKTKYGHHLVINDPVWGGEPDSHSSHEYSSGESFS